jgi:chemotaxis protein MotA
MGALPRNAAGSCNEREEERVDLATIIGLLGATVIILAAIFLGGDPLMFLDLPSVLIVLGGTAFVVMSKFGLHEFAAAFKIAGKAFLFRLDEPAGLIERIVELAGRARRSGLLSLEEQQVSNRFLSDGLRLLVDGHDAEVVKATLSKDRSLTMDRHEWGQRIFIAMADVGPAMGMIGTLVGLVQMLANMDDPKSIGPAMAVALLTTLYGSLLANVVCMPIADKLKLRGSQEALQRALIVDGLLAIQAGQNPRVIEAMLQRYLPEGKRPVPV